MAVLAGGAACASRFFSKNAVHTGVSAPSAVSLSIPVEVIEVGGDPVVKRIPIDATGGFSMERRLK
ncbi:hypothetical protein HNR46_002240 [Haloferula luteola]|uniref:Uncharacterized protein n=1 Tax=Haloferula luteola TaxID=595692 RepID=A0A840VDU2_9BACT|nr:hypothetical protein [Haloferula luteola]MBB5351999.1 hypothetical protein [Haloferula luteola]